LIENDKLIVRDTHTVKELANFVVDKKTYKAEVGYNDDLAMTLVNFGWLTSQRYFREDVQSKIRTVLQEENTRIMDADILPTPIMHTDQQDGTFRDAVDLWFEEGSGKYPWDDFTFDPFAKL
jgi:predicted nucleic-acid-binding protein